MKILSFLPPSIDEKEICRYMKAELNADMKALIDGCYKEAENLLSYQVIYETYPVSFFEESADNGLIDLCFAKVKSKDLYKNLKGFSKIVLFAATVGMGVDRLINRYSVMSPSKALCFQAIGAERVEALCDLFNDRVKSEYDKTAPRFSPGYGDLDLSLQKQIFNALPVGRIGVALNDSLLMSPSKSVTAIIGVK